MQKFSNITNQKTSEEPKVEVKLNEEDLFKSKIMNLLDQLLTIRTYGPIDRYQRAGNIKIHGKELFVEALVGLMTNKSIKDQSKLLENLKSEVNDWKTLDDKIDEMNNTISRYNDRKKATPYINKLRSIFNSYGEDIEMMMQIIEKSCAKLNNPKTTYLRSLAAKEMINDGYPKEIFNKISEKYETRAKELGFDS
jgi:hypothetical protein